MQHKCYANPYYTVLSRNNDKKRVYMCSVQMWFCLLGCFWCVFGWIPESGNCRYRGLTELHWDLLLVDGLFKTELGFPSCVPASSENTRRAKGSSVFILIWFPFGAMSLSEILEDPVLEHCPQACQGSRGFWMTAMSLLVQNKATMAGDTGLAIAGQASHPILQWGGEG